MDFKIVTVSDNRVTDNWSWCLSVKEFHLNVTHSNPLSECPVPGPEHCSPNYQGIYSRTEGQ